MWGVCFFTACVIFSINFLCSTTCPQSHLLLRAAWHDLFQRLNSAAYPQPHLLLRAAAWQGAGQCRSHHPPLKLLHQAERRGKTGRLHSAQVIGADVYLWCFVHHPPLKQLHMSWRTWFNFFILFVYLFGVATQSWTWFVFNLFFLYLYSVDCMFRHVLWMYCHVLWMDCRVLWMDCHVLWKDCHVLWMDCHVLWMDCHVLWMDRHVLWMDRHVLWTWMVGMCAYSARVIALILLYRSWWIVPLWLH